MDDQPNRTTTIADLRGRDLPRAWAEKAHVRPDEPVEVTIRSVRTRESLEAIAAAAAAQAAARGFTPEKIREIIPDFPIEILKG